MDTVILLFWNKTLGLRIQVFRDVTQRLRRWRVRSFATSGTSDPTQIPEVVNRQQHHGGNLKSHNICLVVQQIIKALAVRVNACRVMIQLEVQTRKYKPKIQPPWK